MSKCKLYQKTCLIFCLFAISNCLDIKHSVSRKCRTETRKISLSGRIPYIKQEIEIPACHLPKTTFNMLVDTGSGFSFLDSRFCQEKYLPTKALGKNSSYSYTYATFFRNDLQFEDLIYFTKVIEIPRIEGIMGTSIFRNQAIILDINRKITFIYGDDCLDIPLYDFKSESGLILVSGKINHRNYENLVLDTGASFSFVHDIEPSQCSRKIKKITFKDFNGDDNEGLLCMMDEICLLGKCEKDHIFITAKSDVREKFGYSIIGKPFLEKFSVYIDSRKRKVSLIK